MNKLRRNFKLIAVLGIVFILFAISAITFMPYSFAFAEKDFDDLSAFTELCLDMTQKFDITKEKEVTLNSDDFKVIDGEYYISENAISTYNLKKTNRSSAGFYIVENDIFGDGDNVKVKSYAESNRLIIISDEYVDSQGAVMSARYHEWNVFQYNDAETAKRAYEYYLTLDGVDVSYDAVVSTMADEVQAVNTDTHKYNSWANKYMNYDDYVVGQLNAFDSLPTVYVYVFDTGINVNHILFKGRIETELAKDYVRDGYSYYDKNGHGSHVSGTIAEFTKDNVRIVPIRVLGSNGKGSVTSIITAVEDMISYKTAQPEMKIVMNMSLGVDYSSNSGSVSSSGLNAAVEKAYQNGIVPVVAAGNESQDTSNCSPASVDNAVVVSGLKIATYPNTGLLFDSSYSNFGSHVDFAAPGTDIVSATIDTTTETVSLLGTSMAAPHVTACFALVFSHPDFYDYTQDQAYDLLKANCVDLGSTGRDRYYGWGYINMSFVGVSYSGGSVQFNSNQTSPSQESVSVTLKYEEENPNVVQSSIQIYYTFDESVDAFDRNSKLWTRYSAGEVINLTQSAKISAIATMQDVNGKNFESYLTSKIFYVNNYDIISNFDFDSDKMNVNILRYKGDLTVLNVPTMAMMEGRAIVGIQSSAFARSSVKELNLPSTVKTIYGSAFNSNTSLQRISGEGVTLISDYAFNGCLNLSYINLPNVQRISEYAFADCNKLISANFSKCVQIETGAFVNCTSLSYLNLPSIENVGTHAISNTNLSTLILGENLKTLGLQEELNRNGTVYGYANTKSYDLAISHNLKFYNLTFRVTQMMSENRKYIIEGERFEFEIRVVGLDVKLVQMNHNSNTLNQIGERQQVGDYEYLYKFEYIGTNKTDNPSVVSVAFSDFYQNKLLDGFGNIFSNSGSAKAMEVIVVENDAPSYTLTFEGENYTLKVNGEVVAEPVKLYTIGQYEIEVTPNDGWVLNLVAVSSNPSQNYASTPKFNLPEVLGDVVLVVETRKLGNMSLQFVYNVNGGNAYIDGTIVENGRRFNVSSANNNVAFTVVEDIGYSLVKVSVDGKEISANGGVYSITDIYKDTTIYIDFVAVSYRIEVQCGVGGTYSSSLGELPRGDDREFIVSASDGYVIDTVTINGEVIQVSNNTFIIYGANRDYNIVISFRKVQGLFSEDSVILEYFIIFAIIFVMFILSKLAIYLIRKKNSSKEK